MKTRIFHLIAFISLLPLIACDEERVIRLASASKSDNAEMANHVVSYIIPTAYNTKVEIVSSDDAMADLAAGKVHIVLDAPVNAQVANATSYGELYSGSANKKMVSSDLLKTNPAVATFVEKMQFPQNKLEWSITWMKDKKQSWATGATYFVNTNQTRWKKWGMEESHIESVKKVLAQDMAKLIADKVEF